MKIGNLKEYLAQHGAKPLKTGQSGAEVYEIEEKYVLKYVRRENLESEELFRTYQKEVLFYSMGNCIPDSKKSSAEDRTAAERKLPLPQVFAARASEDELMLLMKKYERPKRKEINRELLKKILYALAQVHSAEIPQFLRQKTAAEPFSEAQIRESLHGWQAVLLEHPGAFEAKWLPQIAARINDVLLWHNSEKQILNHGDFHWDNLLVGDSGEILICDWQSVSVGGASGDLSFLLSRLSADGIWAEAREAVALYAEAAEKLTGKRPDCEALLGHMAAANLMTSFRFWHGYMHGSTEERVRGIYEAMWEDFCRLLPGEERTLQ
ncbi:MAG: aminoglycoside phosphotransferase family protein [Lachnospiraceae bacterium]|nr:aminoglycoside phosphotransferase family protein [Lachnospiraceae bacterium]